MVSGGGFLFRDAAEGVYAGVLQLSLHEMMTLTAFGLIATRMPDGRAGYSLIIFITAEDFPADAAGAGVHAAGCGRDGGGAPDVRRGRAARGVEERHAGRRLLFPRNPVANAPALIAALVERVSGAARQLSAGGAGADRLGDADAGALRSGADLRVRRRASGCWCWGGSARCCRRRRTI